MTTVENQPVNRAIKITDVRYCPNIVIPIAPGGTIIRGPCGAGKSIALDAIGLGLGGPRGRVRPAEDAKRAEIDCLGVLVQVSESRATRHGDLDVGAMEEFDIGGLIDPVVQDPDARNRHGIKALLRLSDAKADPALFYSLAGDQPTFEQLVPPDAVKTDDLVELAGRVKRAFDAQARLQENAAEREEGKAAALRHAGDGLDLNEESDSAKLQDMHVKAVAAQSVLVTKATAARQARDRAADARKQLAAATGSGRSVAECRADEQAAKELFEAANEKVREIQGILAHAQNQAGNALLTANGAKSAREAAERYEVATVGWQKAIEAAEGVEAPSDKEIATAAQTVQVIQQRIERAGVLRDARQKLAQADEHRRGAAEYRQQVARLRNAAKDTDDVLSKAVASSRFRVTRDILFGLLPDGQSKPYYAMSDGERTLIATEEKIERTRAATPDLAQTILVKLPQRTFQDLSPSWRERLFALAAEQNACLISAEVDDGDLRCEVWTPNGAAEVEAAP